MKRHHFITVLIICLFVNSVHSFESEEIDNVNIHDFIQEPLFVSLGSTCEVAHILKANGFRKAAFPFDWITTIDSEKFLDILNQDFKYFLDESYLSVVDSGPGPLIHIYYHLELLHEGNFRGDLYQPNMQKLQSKYKRRIERFRKLTEYQGKVVFLRTAYQYSITDPHRYYHCAANLKISDEYSWKLYHALQNLFPNLDFTLIIINHYTGDSVREEKRLNDNLIKNKSNPYLEPSAKWEAYKEYLTSLRIMLKSES